MPCVPSGDNTLNKMKLVFGIAAIALVVQLLYGDQILEAYRKYIEQNVSKLPYHEKENYCKARNISTTK